MCIITPQPQPQKNQVADLHLKGITCHRFYNYYCGRMGILNPQVWFLSSLKNKRVYLRQQAATSLIPPRLFMASPQELNFHSVHVFVSVLCSLKRKLCVCVWGGVLTKGAGSNPCPHLSLWLKGNKVAAVGWSLIDQWLWAHALRQQIWAQSLKTTSLIHSAVVLRYQSNLFNYWLWSNLVTRLLSWLLFGTILCFINNQ